MEQESKKSLKAPIIILAVVLLAIVVAAAAVKKCPIPVPAGEPAPQPTPPVTAPAKVEEPKVVQPVDAGSTGPVIDRPEAGLRVGHL